MPNKRSSMFIMALALLLLLPVRAQAAAVTLTDFVVGAAGTTVTLFGSITVDALDPDPTYLNGDDVSVDAPLVADDSPFFANTPLSLSFGSGLASTGMVALLNIVIPIDAAEGFYTGSMTFFGGFDASDFTELGVQDFQVQVTDSTGSVPEPATLLLAGSALLALIGSRRRGCPRGV